MSPFHLIMIYRNTINVPPSHRRYRLPHIYYYYRLMHLHCITVIVWALTSVCLLRSIEQAIALKLLIDKWQSNNAVSFFFRCRHHNHCWIIARWQGKFSWPLLRTNLSWACKFTRSILVVCKYDIIIPLQWMTWSIGMEDKPLMPTLDNTTEWRDMTPHPWAGQNKFTRQHGIMEIFIYPLPGTGTGRGLNGWNPPWSSVHSPTYTLCALCSILMQLYNWMCRASWIPWMQIYQSSGLLLSIYKFINL